MLSIKRQVEASLNNIVKELEFLYQYAKDSNANEIEIEELFNKLIEAKLERNYFVNKERAKS
jgi:hypothetical protein